MSQNQPKICPKGLLLVNLGTPRELSVPAVREYLAEFLMDHRVIQAPWPIRALFVHGLILGLKQRHKSSFEAYSKIWTEAGSPLMVYSEQLAAGVRTTLAPEHVLVELAMRYGEPAIGARLSKLVKEGVREIRVLPLYPQWSDAASASVLDGVDAWLKRQPKALRAELKIEVKLDFFSEPKFVSLLAKNLASGLSKKSQTAVRGGLGRDTVLLTYHGLPEGQLPCFKREPYGVCCADFNESNRYCYRAQCFETSWLLENELHNQLGDGELPEIRTTFQSRLGPTQWIKPYTDVEVERMKAERVGRPRRLTVLSPSFVADCLETIEELGMRLTEQWGQALTLIESLNGNPEWIAAVSQWALSQDPAREWMPLKDWKKAVYGK